MANLPENIEHTLRTIFKRCVQCPDEVPPCPPCKKGDVCSQSAQSCTRCVKVECVPQDAAGQGPSISHKSGPNVGAIAGGVVGGLIFIAILTYCVWRFCLKGRRQQYQESQWEDMDAATEKRRSEFTMRRDARMSTHTVASMASTVLTRASNIIQIAYIPGVTNRSGPGSPGLLVPPVPPIPAMSPSTPGGSPYTDQLFFTPGELRDSTYSGLSGDGRSSFRTSITPSLARTSVATTIYRDNAVVSPLPAQTIVRGKAAVVSVKSSGQPSPAESPSIIDTPPVPQVEMHKYVKPIKIQMPGSSTPSIRSTPAGSVRSITIGKPKPLEIVKKPSSLSRTESSEPLQPTDRPESVNTNRTHSRAERSTLMLSDSESDAETEPRRSLMNSSPKSARDSHVTEIMDTPQSIQGSFTGSNSNPGSPDPGRKSSGRMSTVMEIEEATRRASMGPKGGLGRRRDESPFSDSNEVR
ncbi:hypothetical protein M501DRAFT_1013459 [Patellaria atrata CBS 101060]|uniref:Membrane anchor Opy2 N-terminal domain-containing protein n=1 Tax=Patellaria atrata CBS 101060 TaxID=1346257 RepID=A0A9P4SGI3_9PEZI|nr:hypothetical protein M501DRAFT_1013459 [Patellaria atrata CBS 101060]